MKMAHKHLALAGVILAAVCVLAGGALAASRSAQAGDLGRPLADEKTPMKAVSADAIEVSIESSYLDADRVTVEYLLKGVSEVPRGNPMWTCPIRKTILMDSQGRGLGSGGTHVYCARTAPGTYRVVQDFFQPVPLEPRAEMELTLRVVVDLDANVLPDGTVGGLDSVGASARNVLDDADSPADPPPQTHVLKFAAAPRGNLTITEPQQVEHNGLQAELRRLEILSAVTRAEICLDLPDAGNWHPEVSLAQGAGQGLDYNWELLDASDPSTFASSHRCYRFTFPFAYRGGAGEPPLRLHIERLVVPPSENEVYDPAVCERARQRLAEGATGIEVQCQTEERARGAQNRQDASGHESGDGRTPGHGCLQPDL